MPIEKVFSIKIDGLESSIKSVQTLASALERLEKSVANETKATVTINNERKESKQTLTELEKVTKTYNSLMGEEGEQLYKLKQAITERKKELKDSMDLEKANKVIEEGSVETYNQKQQRLTSLGKVIRNYVASTEEEKKHLDDLKKEYLNLNNELTEFDREMGVSSRLVGKYNQEATIPLKQELRQLMEQMQKLRDNGVAPTSESYKKLQARAAELTDIMGDVRAETKALASDTHALDVTLGALKDGVAVFGLWQSSMTALGVESESLENAMKKLVSVQTALNSLQTISNSLQDKSSLLYKAKIALLGTYSKAQQGATVATKAFGVALKSIGIGLVISAIAMLTEYWDDLKGYIKDSGVNLDGLSKGFDKFMSVVKGVGNVVINSFVNPLKSAYAIGEKLINLDFKGAFNEAVDGYKRQFDVITAFQEGYTKSEARNAEERTRNQKAELAKRLKAQIEYFEVISQEDFKYTEQGKKLYSQYYQALTDAEKKGTDERRQAELEQLKFQRDLAKKEDEELKKRIEAQKKFNEDYKKNLESFRKETETIGKANQKSQLDVEKEALEATVIKTKEGLDAKEKQWKVYYASLNTMTEQETDTQKEMVQKQFDELIKSAKKAGQNVEALQNELAGRLIAIETQLGYQLQQNDKALSEQLKKDREEWTKNEIAEIGKIIEDGQRQLNDRLTNIQNTSLKNPTVAMLRESESQYRDYINDLTTEHERFIALIEEEMKRLNPDSDEYAKLVAKKESVDKDYETKFRATTTKIADLQKQQTDTVISNIQSYSDKIMSIYSGVNALMAEIGQSTIDGIDAEIESIGTRIEGVSERIQSNMSKINELETALQSASEENRERLQEEMALYQSKADQEKSVQQDLFNQQKRLENEKANIEYKQKKNELTNTLLSSIAQSALAIVQCFSQLGPIGGAISAVGVGATTALQIATISRNLQALKPIKYENGGLLEGKRHSQGGIPVGNTGIEVEGGEFVVNRRATARYLDILEKLNSYGQSGMKRQDFFANGGQLSVPSVGRDYGTEQILNAIRSQQIVVSVKDITRKQNEMNNVRTLARG